MIQNENPIFSYLSRDEMINLTFREQVRISRQKKEAALRNNKNLKTTHSNNSLLIAKPANEWIREAKNTAIPNQLFGEFWFENEVCILFADTNVGKSILAVQIANSISKGTEIEGFNLQCKKQGVLYFDFELTKKQFENRYSDNFKNHYEFDDNLQRIEINPDYEYSEVEDFEKQLGEAFENAIKVFNSKILIIDNITFLREDTEKAKDALPLMKLLKRLKNTYNLSILILAHTPKRDSSKPITINDLQGSKMIGNFCDSAFALGQSHNDSNLRYIKQIKVRNAKKNYDAENVVVCKLEKPNNFLQISFMGHDSEYKHLKNLTNEAREERKEKAIEMKNNGLTNKEIGAKFGVSEGAVRKWLKDPA